MTPQEEQFLQAAKEAHHEYVQANLNNIGLEVKTVAFVLTPSIEISQILLENGVNINVQATEIVDYRQLPEVITWTSAIVNPHSEDDYISCWTALSYACKHNYLQKAKWLIEKGANKYKASHLVRPDRFTPAVYDWTPQDIAFTNGHLTLAELVRIDNTRHSTKQDLFFDAVKSGFEEEVKNHLQQDININITNDKKETALIVAAKYKRHTVLDILLAANADITLRDKDGFSALLHAIQSGSFACVISLLQAGADPNDKLFNNRTALMLAAREGHIEIFKQLLKNGATFSVRDDSGYSVFLYAAIGGNVEILQELLQLGADINDTNTKGLSALMLAVRNEHVQAVRFLLERGGKVNISDSYGQTALKIASVHNKPAIVELLKSAGAKE